MQDIVLGPERACDALGPPDCKHVHSIRLLSDQAIEDRLAEKLASMARKLTFSAAKPFGSGSVQDKRVYITSLPQWQNVIVHNVVVLCMQAYRRMATFLKSKLAKGEMASLKQCSTHLDFERLVFASPAEVSGSLERSILWEAWAMARLGVSLNRQFLICALWCTGPHQHARTSTHTADLFIL